MDQNLSYVVGKVTWFQNWEPKQWGGTLACRIALPDINIEGVGSIEKQTVFAKIGYKKEEMEWNIYKNICSIMESSAFIKLSGATIVHREKDGNHEYSLKTNLLSCSEALASEEYSNCVIHGQCSSHNGEWLQVKASYRNPQKKEKMYRYINILDLENQANSLQDKWITVFGRLAGKDINGNDAVYVVADKII